LVAIFCYRDRKVHLADELNGMSARRNGDKKSPWIVACATVALMIGIARAYTSDDGTGRVADLRPSPSHAKPAIGNPLWAIPLGQLTTTLERPIFSPSRRPPPPVVVARPFIPPPPPPPRPPPPPERPSLALLGTIAGEGNGLAMFMEPATQIVVRLRTGEAHQGWVLRSVRARNVLFEKDRRTEIVSLPDPGSEAPAVERRPPRPPPPGIRGPRRY
jgi:hypothetical protein